jgi:hypothetical protein
MKSKDLWHGTVGISMIIAVSAVVAGVAYLLWGPPVPYWPFGGPPIGLAANATTTVSVRATTADLSEKDGTLFSCEGGAYLKAAFSSNSVRLALSDGREVTLPQINAETGVRYANPDESFVFLNEGSIVFIKENGAETYSGCTAASQ